MNPGGGFDFPFGRLTFTPAWHSSSFPDGTYGGMPMGVVVAAGGKRLYHAGDTALFSDMQLIGRHGLDVALLPIGRQLPHGSGRCPRGGKAAEARPRGAHSLQHLRRDQAGRRGLKRRVEAETDSECLALVPGEGFEA